MFVNILREQNYVVHNQLQASVSVNYMHVNTFVRYIVQLNKRNHFGIAADLDAAPYRSYVICAASTHFALGGYSFCIHSV